MSLLPPALATSHALFLDFDGTLIGFARTPDDVTLPRRSVELVERVYLKLERRAGHRDRARDHQYLAAVRAAGHAGCRQPWRRAPPRRWRA